MSNFFKSLGEYPPEYNREIHGPYDPAVNYGPRDTPLSQVRLCELPSWLKRQKKSPRAIAQAMSRVWWRYQHKYILPRKPGPTGIFQVVFFCGFSFFLLTYSDLQKERRCRYH